MNKIMKNKMVLGLVTSLLQIAKHIENLFFSDLSPGKFGDLVKHGFWVIPKIIFANLRKPIQDMIIIPLSSGPLKVENVERMGEKSQRFKDV